MIWSTGSTYGSTRYFSAPARDSSVKGPCPRVCALLALRRSPKARFTWRTSAPGSPSTPCPSRLSGPPETKAASPIKGIAANRLFQAQRFPLPVPPSGPHSRLYAQFEVRGGGRRRFPAPPGVQRRPLPRGKEDDGQKAFNDEQRQERTKPTGTLVWACSVALLRYF